MSASAVPTDSFGADSPSLKGRQLPLRPAGFSSANYRIPDGSGVDTHHVRVRGAETDTSPTARRVLLHFDSQVAHAGFAQ